MKVLLTTTYGKITLQLDAEKAPGTTENFVQYVKEGHFDGTIFHRVISNFMIQGGGFTEDMQQKPTRATIQNEAGNGLSNKAGTIAMARTPDPIPPPPSSSSTWLITTSWTRNAARTAGAMPYLAPYLTAWTWWKNSRRCHWQ